MSAIPLYKLVTLNELGDSQFMDKETIEWISSSSVGDGPLWPITLNNEDFQILESLIPLDDYFLNSEVRDSIHGIRHILRVVVNITMICKLLNIQNSRDYQVAASIHDLRRLNDKRDLGHGARAWEWFEENLSEMPQHSSLISNTDVVKYSTVFHDTDYEEIPVSVLKKYRYHIDVLKAADALDRFRQPNSRWWPNMEYISLKEVEKLISLSKRLTVNSERRALSGVGSARSVIMTARELLS